MSLLLIYTVEPPIKDTPIKTHFSIKDKTMSQFLYILTSKINIKDTLLYKQQNSLSKQILYSEVPLYTIPVFVDSIVFIYNLPGLPQGKFR